MVIPEVNYLLELYTLAREGAALTYINILENRWKEVSYINGWSGRSGNNLSFTEVAHPTCYL
jgi:hypothetical protein